MEVAGGVGERAGRRMSAPHSGGGWVAKRICVA
jgi:hypothetical protein